MNDNSISKAIIDEVNRRLAKLEKGNEITSLNSIKILIREENDKQEMIMKTIYVPRSELSKLVIEIMKSDPFYLAWKWVIIGTLTTIGMGVIIFLLSNVQFTP